MLTVADLIRYRMQHERYVRRVAETILPTRFGDFRMIAYASDVDHDQHVALVRGELEGDLRACSRSFALFDGRCFRLDVLRLQRLVERSLEAIAKENRGVFLYLHHTGRGFGIDQPDEAGKLRQFTSTRAVSLTANRPPAHGPARKRHRRANSDRSRPP